MIQNDPLVEDILTREALPNGAHLLGDQFTITKRLSAGGFGITYKALDNVLGRSVVIKECFSDDFCLRKGSDVVARTDQFDKQFRSIVEMFMREARSLAQLRHPNIVGVHRAFEENQTAYMALDLIDGNDLHDIIYSSPEPLPPKLVTEMLFQLLDAIEKVHDADLLHRDISPDNILLENDGNPVLIDFGAARGDASRRTRAVSSLLVVKEGYSPKEFYVAGSIQTPSSDLYALGATFYHVLSGDAPVDSQTRMAAVASNKPDPCVPLVGRIEGYSEAFLAAIDQAMQLIPSERLQSASDWYSMISGSRADTGMDAAMGQVRGAAAPVPAELGHVLSQLVEETNEEVRKSELVAIEPATDEDTEPKKPAPRAASVARIVDTVPDWVDEFNQETFEAVKPAEAHRDDGASEAEETIGESPVVTEGHDPNLLETAETEAIADPIEDEPDDNDWISKARRKQTRLIEAQSQDLLPAVEPQIQAEASADIPVEVAATAAAEAQPQSMLKPLMMYLSIGIAIGLGLTVVQITFFL